MVDLIEIISVTDDLGTADNINVSNFMHYIENIPAIAYDFSFKNFSAGNYIYINYIKKEVMLYNKSDALEKLLKDLEDILSSDEQKELLYKIWKDAREKLDNLDDVVITDKINFKNNKEN